MDSGTDNSDISSHIVTTALLSVAGVENSDTLSSVCDIPLISIQIHELSGLGITHFCIEVESISSALTAMADNLREEGIQLQFVRSSSELRDAIPEVGMICVFGAGIFADSKFLANITRQGQPILLTLENDEDRQGFERIDLESQWSGIAITDCSLIRELGELPDGYSLPSAILRQVIKAQIPVHQLNMQEITAASLKYAGDKTGAVELANAHLSAAAVDESGVIERQVFVPLSAWAGRKEPAIFKTSDMAALGLAAVTAILAYFVPVFAAAFTSLLALFFLCTARVWARLTMRNAASISAIAAVVLLIIGLGIAAWRSFDIEGIFAALIVGGLAIALHHLVASKAVQQRLSSALLPAPALLALALFGAAFAGVFAFTLMIFALLQLATLLFLLPAILRGLRNAS